jgi:hypothetical protein
MKQCSRCKEEKPLTEFYADPGGRDGRKSYCIACRKAWHQANYVRKPSHEDRRRRARRPRVWVAQDPERSRYFRHKKRPLTPEQ